MRLKKHYGEDGRVAYIEVKHTGSAPEQNFSVQLVTMGTEEGWMTLQRGKLILHQKDATDDLVYNIVRGPGRYCCHCRAKLPDDAQGLQAQLHVAQTHPGVDSPDPNNPSGYARVNAYQCVLGAEQHALYRAMPSR